MSAFRVGLPWQQTVCSAGVRIDDPQEGAHLPGRVAVSGVIAFIGAVYMGDNGMLGSCFEGACGYAAIFVAFPLLWLGLTAAFVGGWILISFRGEFEDNGTTVLVDIFRPAGAQGDWTMERLRVSNGVDTLHFVADACMGPVHILLARR